jgi:hypothetical protein
MKKLILVLTAVMGYLCSGFGQYATVSYDIEKNYFNEGQPLPAEKSLMFTGVVPPSVDIIEINIFHFKSRNDKNRLYVASWKDFDNNANASYNLAVNYPLRASEKYDFRIDFFQKTAAGAQEQLTDQIVKQIMAYLDANIRIKGNSIELTKSAKKMIKEMDAIVDIALKDYRTQHGSGFTGLSATLSQKLSNMESINFGQLAKDSSASTQQTNRKLTLAGYIEDLKSVVSADIRELMNSPWSKLMISRYVDDYETEQKKGFFSLSLGYGGVYLNGQLEDLNYGSSPYAGLALPLSNSSIAPEFLRNSSIVLGVFLQDFEDEQGNKISGMIVEKPIYLGLDYKLFEFVHFNAGAAFLEKTETLVNVGGNDQVNKSSLIRPFIGLSARIDLSVRFGR